MKLLFLILLSFPAFSANFASTSTLEGKKEFYFAIQSQCEQFGEQCFDIGPDANIPFVKLGFFKLSDELIDGEPIWSSKQNETSCATGNECSDLLGDLCSSLPGYQPFYAFKNAIDGFSAYCSKLLGYEKVNSGKKIFELDHSKIAAYKAQDALNKALLFAKSLRECGGRVMDLMLVRNQPKGLSSEQVKALVSTYAPIQGLLSSGSLVSAKEEIAKVSADGVLVTEADKAALSAQIDKCLAGLI